MHMGQGGVKTCLKNPSLSHACPFTELYNQAGTSVLIYLHSAGIRQIPDNTKGNVPDFKYGKEK